jgi:predicted ATPase
VRFIVENFGPIEKADITLKELNIFIGRNSEGKSYLAYLIWALLSVEPDWNKLRELFDEFVPNEFIRKVIEKDKELRGKMENKEYVDELRAINEQLAMKFKALIMEVFRRFDDIWGRNLEKLLKDTFLVDNLSELLRVGKDKAKLVICDDKCKNRINIEINDGKLKSWIDNDVFEILEENVHVTTTVGKPIYLSILYEEYTYDVFFTENYQTVEVIPIISMWLFDEYTPYLTTFIAPDGRTGLVRSIEAYNYALISSKVTINEVDRAFMRDFVSLYPETKNEEINRIAYFLEKKLDVGFSLRRELPRYIVKVGKLEIPLQRAPSGYRELAPIIYVMKHKLDKGHVIFIEEPEAHLHPDVQIIVTRALAGLSKYCYVIVTTHSIAILDEVNNLLRVSKLSSETKKKYGYEDWEGIEPNNIKIFLISKGNIRELEIYEDGIEASDLDKVVIEIANIHARISEEYEHSRRLSTQR